MDQIKVVTQNDCGRKNQEARIWNLEELDRSWPDDALGPLRVAEAVAHDTGLRSKGLVKRLW